MEDRTYKLLIVDSIMNLFRQSRLDFRSRMTHDTTQVRTTPAVASFRSDSRSACSLFLVSS